MSTIGKCEALVLVFEMLEEMLAISERNCEEAQERVKEAEGAMISRYDTMKEEGQYLVAGLLERQGELRSAVIFFHDLFRKGNPETSKSVGVISLVEVELADGRIQSFLVLPYLGGQKILDRITIVSPEAPIAKSIMGKEAGEEFSYMIGGKCMEGEIIHVE